MVRFFAYLSTNRTKYVSVQPFLEQTVLINQSVMVDFFYCEKNHPILKWKDGVWNENN